jgi:predicted amidophosphoribosyltransferase
MIETMVNQQPLDPIEVGRFNDPLPRLRSVAYRHAGSRGSCSSCGNQTGRDAALCPWCGRVALKDAASDPEAAGDVTA